MFKSLPRETVMEKLKKLQNFIKTYTKVALIIDVLLPIVFGISFATIILVLGSIGVFFYLMIEYIAILRNSTLAKISILTLRSIIGILVLSFVIIESLIIINFKAEVKDDIGPASMVILGAGLNGDQVSNRLQRRLDEGISYLIDHKDVPVIVSGGQGPDEFVSEAIAMGRYLVKYGIQSDRIYYEDQSTSTVENIKFSKEVLKDELSNKSESIILVTSDYHMFRAKLIAQDMGLTCYGLPSESEFFVRVNYALREYFGVIKDGFIILITTLSQGRI